MQAVLYSTMSELLQKTHNMGKQRIDFRSQKENFIFRKPKYQLLIFPSYTQYVREYEVLQKVQVTMDLEDACFSAKTFF